MDLPELKDRLARGEDLHTDFKQRLGSPAELAKDLVCFANTDGGQIIVGVADDRIRLVREATGREVEISVRDFEVLLTIPRRLRSA